MASGPEWDVFLDGVREPELVKAEITVSSNPFGSHSLAYINDVDGERYEAYSVYDDIRFTVYPDGASDVLTVESGDTYTIPSGETENHRIVNVGGTLNVEGTLNVDSPDTTIDRFPGFVADIEEKEQGSADRFVVEAHSYDQFLRGEVVDEDLSGSTIFDALNTIITTYTPVTWDASNVEVGDNQELTQSFRGEKVEDVLLQLAFKSVAEEFGVNRDLEFFFRPLEASSSPRDIDGANLIAMDIEEDGRAAPNQVTVWFDGGDRSVTVSISPDKLDRQDAVGTDRPVTKAVEITRENITDISDAEDAGRRYLEQQQNRFLGDAVTLDLYDAEIGDVISVTSARYDIDSDFRIAGLEYVDAFETIVSIVDKRKEQDQRLINMGETLDRVEQRPANRDATRNEVLDTNAVALFRVTADVGGTTFATSRFVNAAREKVRDAWRDSANSPLDIANIAVGTDGSSLSRTDTALVNETERESVTESLSGDFAVEYSNSVDFTESNIREIGLFDSAGDMVCRLVNPDDGISNATVTVTITVLNDDTVPKGVLTDHGREAVRDIVADNSPTLPAKYGYGDDGTEPAASDTALGNQLIALDLSSVLIQDATSDADFANILDSEPGANDPWEVSGDTVTTLQTSFPVEAEDFDRSNDLGSDTGNDDYSDGGRIFFNDQNQGYAEWDFTPAYDIPAANLEIHYRNSFTGDGTGTVPDIVWYVNGVEVGDTNNPQALDWNSVNVSGLNEDLAAGETHTIRAEHEGGTHDEARLIDVVAPLDDRFSYTFDNTLNQNQGWLDGPEEYPDLVEVLFATASTRRDMTEASVESTWNDTSNSQFIELRIGSDSFDRTSNSTTASTTHSGSGARTADVRVGLSRWAENGARDQTPRLGYTAQSIDAYELFGNPAAITPSGVGAVNIRAIASPGDLQGETIREAGALDSSDATLTRSVLADLAVGANQRIISSERNAFDNE